MTSPAQAPAFSLLTDFGYDDPYAGELRAVLRRLAPHVPCLDLSHGVPPFSVTAGAFFLAAARPHHAAGTIFLCVVDPGVGSMRDLLCITDGAHTLLGPDNGLLSLAGRDMRKEGRIRAWRIPPFDTRGVFHGRDILAPLAAKLALGASPDDFGDALESEDAEVRLSPAWAVPAALPEGLLCVVLHVDRFGNCVLNLPLGHPPPKGPLLPAPGKGGAPVPLIAATHYAAIPADGIGLMPGSQGFYELACDRRSAAELLKLAAGDLCVLGRK